MATPLEVLKSKVGILADPIAEYVAAILADYSGIVVPLDATGNPPVDGSGTPEIPPVVTPPVETAPTLPTIADTDTVYQIVDHSGGNFVKGISVKDNAVLLRPAQAVKAGLKLRFKNGQGSIIVSNEPVAIAGVTLAKVVVGAITLTEALGAPGSVTLYGMATAPTPTPEPTPDPTPTPNPEPSTQYKNIPLGVNGHEGRELTYPKAEMEARIKLLADNNLKSYRTDVGTGYLDNTTEMNRLIGLCQKYGVILRPMIYPTTEANAYRYAKLYGDRVKVWEIGNEINLQGKTAAANVIPNMVATYKGMKRASDELGLNLKFTINVTACNSHHTGAACYGDVRGEIWFLEQAKAAGFNFDYVSFHYYAYIGELGSWYDLYFGQIVAISKMYGAKVFFNEMNAGEIYKAGTTGNEVSTANSLRQFLNEAQKYKDYIQEINVYEFLDEPNMEGQEAHFGIRTNLATKKPLWDVVTEFSLAKIELPVDVSGDVSYMRKKGRIFVNLGMGAGADHVLPGKEGTNYTFLTEPEIKRAVGYGFKQFRVGFIMGRVYKQANSLEMYRGIDANDTTRKYTLDTIIERLKICNKYNTKVLLDNHVYAFWPSNGAPNKVELGTAGYTAEMLANHWYGIIQELKKDPEAWNAVYGFDIVNEPYTLSDSTWSKCVQAVIDKCAPISEDKIFVIEGISYSSTRNWVANNPSLSKITHPRGKAFLEFSGHLYLDPAASGYYSGDTLSATDIRNGITFETIGTARLAGFKKWKDDNKVNASIGENLVTGTYPNLMIGERNLLEDCINSGIDVYLFGMGDGFGSGNAHNIELKTSSIDNTNMLNLAIEMAKK